MHMPSLNTVKDSNPVIDNRTFEEPSKFTALPKALFHVAESVYHFVILFIFGIPSLPFYGTSVMKNQYNQMGECLSLSKLCVLSLFNFKTEEKPAPQKEDSKMSFKEFKALKPEEQTALIERNPKIKQGHEKLLDMQIDCIKIGKEAADEVLECLSFEDVINFDNEYDSKKAKLTVASISDSMFVRLNLKTLDLSDSGLREVFLARGKSLVSQGKWEALAQKVSCDDNSIPLGSIPQLRGPALAQALKHFSPQLLHLLKPEQMKNLPLVEVDRQVIEHLFAGDNEKAKELFAAIHPDEIQAALENGKVMSSAVLSKITADQCGGLKLAELMHMIDVDTSKPVNLVARMFPYGGADDPKPYSAKFARIPAAEVEKALRHLAPKKEFDEVAVLFHMSKEQVQSIDWANVKLRDDCLRDFSQRFKERYQDIVSHLSEIPQKLQGFLDRLQKEQKALDALYGQ